MAEIFDVLHGTVVYPNLMGYLGREAYSLVRFKRSPYSELSIYIAATYLHRPLTLLFNVASASYYTTDDKIYPTFTVQTLSNERQVYLSGAPEWI